MYNNAVLDWRECANLAYALRLYYLDIVRIQVAFLLLLCLVLLPCFRGGVPT